ncbi:reverse transcriptase family protein, partial [Streptococcus agalactiae]
VYTNADKAETFADTLERECRENTHPEEDEQHERKVRRVVRRLRSTEDLEEVKPTSPTEVEGIIKRLKNRKAPGKDGITNVMVKQLPRKGIAAITNIINAVLRTRHFPTGWKQADIIMFSKPKKDKVMPQNYRPISLLPAISKIAERVILRQLKQEAEDLELLPSEQFGFRNKHSTELQLLRIVEHASQHEKRGRTTAMLLLDVERAFDRVWHDGLIFKMVDAGFSKRMCQLMDNYIRRRNFRVKVGHEKSEGRTPEAGVPQGAVLSPLLYNIYTHDIPRPSRTSLALYADDTAILASHKWKNTAAKHLQDATDQILDWFILWKIKVNVDKTQAILLGWKRDDCNQRIVIENKEVPWKNSVTYLGVLLDQRLTFRQHIQTVVDKAKGCIAQLYPLLNRKSQLSLQNKLTLIKTVIRPTLLYASTAWGHAANDVLMKIQRIENKLLRMALDAPWFVRNTQIYRDLDWQPIQIAMKEKAKNTFKRAEEHPNPELRRLVNYEIVETACRKKRPRHQL